MLVSKIRQELWLAKELVMIETKKEKIRSGEEEEENEKEKKS